MTIGTDGGASPSALAGAIGEMSRTTSGFSAELAEVTREMRGMDQEARRLSRSLGSSLRSAFDKAVFGGEKLGRVFRDLAGSVVSRSLTAALRPVENAIGQGFAGLLSGAFGFKDGGAFGAGRVRAFARGGVVDGPTLFPMRGGTGLMGEAGPEAIMPLTRGPDGKLGVAAQGGGRGASITVNISTPDLEGFQRSRGQVAAQLARAVARGQRGL
ncbi:MAG: phage tail tape measure protein [Pseudomonadota bacterium]